MNYYELMAIFTPGLSEEEQKTQSQQLEELLKSQNAAIHLSDHWGKRKLAYPVKKQRQGYYDWFYFEMDPSRVSEVDRKLKMSETVLRFMILKMENAQIQNLKREMERRSAAAQQAAEPAESTAEIPVETPAEEPIIETAQQEPAAQEE